MEYYIIAIILFLLLSFVIHKLAYNRFKKITGRTPKRKELWSIYHWEGVLGISAVIVLILVYILKTTNVLTL
ncbi:hypothetical protein J1D01_02090 [Seonamhaeicola sp. NFXS20]|uniref:hypothetical protein n=1 Tax=unclassified Seonamhaeicola TaxID=2622645 RepID=UPI0035620728